MAVPVKANPRQPQDKFSLPSAFLYSKVLIRLSLTLSHTMAEQKCVHKGCGKTFTDPSEECVYHPGPPIFHEGQKGTSSAANGLLSSALSFGTNTPNPRLEML